MKVLVTGGAGFIGSHVVDLLMNDYDIRVADNYSSSDGSNLENFLGKQSWVDITDVPNEENRFAWYGLVRSYRPDCIIHLAAQPSLLASVQDPIHDAQTNIMGTINLLTASIEFGVKKFIFASTSAVYNYEYPPDFTEDLLNGIPSSPYGLSKLCAEQYIRLLFPNHAILRLANIYGPRQQPLGENQLIPRAIRHILYGDEFEIYGDGEQTRDFLYVEDVAKAILTAVQSPVNGTFNISYGDSYTVNDVLEMLRQISNFDGVWVHGEDKQDRKYVYMNNKRARTALGWEPKIPLEEGLRKTWEWWNEKS